MNRDTMMKMTQEERNALATTLEGEATKRYERADQSWERSDTDGFLSQWASGLTAEEKQTQARILRAGGRVTFQTIVDLDGNELRGRVVVVKNRFSYQYERKFMVLDEYGRSTGEFIPLRFTQRSKWWSKYRPASIEDWAWAKIVGRGRGLSGTSWVEIIRLRK